MLTSDLSIPERVAVAIVGLRPTAPRGDDGEPQISDVLFADHPQTCELDGDIVRRNIGRAQVLIDEGRVPKLDPEPTYDREARINHGIAALLGIMPTRDQVRDRLALYGFKPAEIDNLFDELIARTADAFHADRAPLKPTGAGGIPDWGRIMLERNAE